MELVFNKVAVCNFVNSKFNHTCYLFLKACWERLTEQNPHCFKKCKRPKIQHKVLAPSNKWFFWELIVFAKRDLSKETKGDSKKRSSKGFLYKMCPQKFIKFHKKTAVLESLKKVAGLRPATILKRRFSAGVFQRILRNL